MTFAGSFDVGITQAGFQLRRKLEMAGGFGLPQCEGNRGVLGDAWDAQACDAAEWEPLGVDAVFGCPPCSAWSRLSDASFRGADSSISHCMWSWADYVAACNPRIAVMESVQHAYKDGLPMMRGLRDRVEQSTGKKWSLTHVLHNNASVGGASIRRRYFMVLSRVPFGIERPVLTRTPTLLDVIGDLQGTANTWEAQPYRRPASWWAESKRTQTNLVDGCVSTPTPWTQRALDLLDGVDEWRPKEKISSVARRYHAAHGRLPASWDAVAHRQLIERDFENMGFSQMRRWDGNKMARVIVADSPRMVLHPIEHRLITFREVARIMGFPDTWLLRPLKDAPNLGPAFGKAVSVECGRWIAQWARLALEGQPGGLTGEPRGAERERVIDVTEDYRAVCQER